MQLSWSSTNAAACALVSDIQGASGTVATSGTEMITLPPLHGHIPPTYIAGLQCSDAGNNVSNASASVVVH